jgi:hypothetical protein
MLTVLQNANANVNYCSLCFTLEISNSERRTVLFVGTHGKRNNFTKLVGRMAESLSA